MVNELTLPIILVISLAYFFDFVNGWNDAANSIATVVSTRVLKPVQAVILAALMNFVAFFIYPHAVAVTVGKGLVDVKIVSPEMILAGIIAAIFWGVIATLLGLPVSMSHTLIGGLIGAAVAKAGFSSLVFSGIFTVFLFLVLAPILGFILGLVIAILIFNLFRNQNPYFINRLFGRLQLISASFYSMGHGANDALKTAGILTALLISIGYLEPNSDIPFWVVLFSYLFMALGTLAGGWRVVRTLGKRITYLRPVDGFCAETGGGTFLLISAIFGIPVSTTHTIVGSIMGVGALKKIKGVRWGVTRNIVYAWILTIPLTALIAFIVYNIFVLIKFRII